MGVLWVVEGEFRSWVREQVLASFEQGVEGILEARTERLEETMRVSREMVEEEEMAELLVAALERDLTDAEMERVKGRCEALFGQAQKGPPQRGRPNRGETQATVVRQLPMLALMTMEGELRFLGHREEERPGKDRRGKIRDFAKVAAGGGEQAVGYVKREVMKREVQQRKPGGRGREQVREVVATPIRVGGTMKGWTVLGQDAETMVDRAFSRMEETNGRQMRSGLVVDREWMVDGVDEELAEKLNSTVGDKFWEEGEPLKVTVDGVGYLLVARDLNPGSPLGKGYQVGVFPLERLEASVGRLRWSVAGMGGVGVLLAGVVGWWLSRRFSRPIDELVAGTERVRSGDYGVEVKVGSKDEFGMLAGAFNEMTGDLALKERYHDVLRKTSDPGVVQRLIDGSMELGGEVRDVAVIFCDIRGFTAMTEGMAPGGVIELLNEHMTAMTEVIHRHGGVVDKFVGDLVMAVFGAPLAVGDDLERAARCAVEMVEERARLNEEGGLPVEIGVGMAWGEAVSGLMGSKDRLNYTVLGERVNLASRLCSLAGPGEVAVDGETAERLEGLVVMESKGKAAVKGFREEVEVVLVRGR